MICFPLSVAILDPIAFTTCDTLGPTGTQCNHLLECTRWRSSRTRFAISPSARRKQARPERPRFERSALARIRGFRVDATLCHATLYRATLCHRRRGRQFDHGVYV